MKIFERMLFYVNNKTLTNAWSRYTWVTNYYF